ncbi:MAG: aldo/keto reductase [Pedobacter sp.]|nr:MAG: aldo/keto reductase [Pedobacter sp.]
MSIKKIALGSQGLNVPIIGLGCMGMTGFQDGHMYGPADEAEAIATIHRSLELGGNFLDTADLYGPLKNEQLIAKAIAGNRGKYIIASKFGWEIDDNDTVTWQINGKPEYVKKAIERSLKNLNTDYIDLYYMHRLDRNTPIEETVGAMSDLVKEGKIGYVGLSEVSSETIRRAQAIHPITAVQTEYSLFERTVEERGILATLKELGIGFVPFSPLGKGFLTGAINEQTKFESSDFRNTVPRFNEENRKANQGFVEVLKGIAAEMNASPAQVALAWLLAQKPWIAPIPGTTKVHRLQENLDSANLMLSAADLSKITEASTSIKIQGDRYAAHSQKMVGK